MPVNHKYDKYIAEAQRKHGVPAHLLKGLIEVESGGDPGAVSYAGARGITQFMPGTAPSYGVKFGTSDAAVRTQILGAAAYLKRHGYGKPGRTKFSIAAYNGGAGNPQYGYAQKVLDATRKYKGKTNTAGVPARSGGTRTTTTKTVGSKTVELSPAIDNSAARTALLTDFLTERKKDRHKAVMALALGSAQARDEPAVTAQVPVTKTTTTTTKGKGAGVPTANPNDGEKIYGGKAWGGSQNVVRYAEGIAKGMGVPVGSGKRGTRSTASGNVSDHFVGATQSYARDFPVGGKKAAQFAHAVARKLGVKNYSTGNFNHYNITDARGRKFRVQILWNVANHRDGDNPHVHVGIKRVG